MVCYNQSIKYPSRLSFHGSDRRKRQKTKQESGPNPTQATFRQGFRRSPASWNAGKKGEKGTRQRKEARATSNSLQNQLLLQDHPSGGHELLPTVDTARDDLTITTPNPTKGCRVWQSPLCTEGSSSSQRRPRHELVQRHYRRRPETKRGNTGQRVRRRACIASTAHISIMTRFAGGPAAPFM